MRYQQQQFVFCDYDCKDKTNSELLKSNIASRVCIVLSTNLLRFQKMLKCLLLVYSLTPSQFQRALLLRRVSPYRVQFSSHKVSFEIKRRVTLQRNQGEFEQILGFDRVIYNWKVESFQNDLLKYVLHCCTYLSQISKSQRRYVLCM